MKQSLLPNKSIKIDAGGSQNMTLTPITVGRKVSHSITSRTLRARTKQTKDIMGMIAGNSCDAVSTQTSHLVKSLDASAREEILKSINHTVTVPVEYVAAMKSTLNLTWNLTLKYLDDLKSTNLYDHPFIPTDEVHLNMGSDHGGGGGGGEASFKATF